MSRLIFVLVASISLVLFSCGSSTEDEQEDNSLKNCQACCTKIMQCDKNAAMTAEMLADCNNNCKDETVSAKVQVDEIDLECFLTNQYCEEFLACRKDKKNIVDPWCTDWCRRCSQCSEDTEFAESMCKSASYDDQENCLESCDEKLDNAENSCKTLFEFFKPNDANCEEMATNNPFDQGC